jgi:hypothetical protein
MGRPPRVRGMDRGSQKRVIAGGFGGDYLSIETVR